MPEHHTGVYGGTMRLGKRTTIFRGDSKIRKQHDSFTFLSVAPTHTSPILVSGQLYNNKQQIEERHRHRYEVNPDYVAQLESHGMRFVGTDSEKERMEIMELKDHVYYVATQFHPEYLSRPLKPSPPFLGLILAAVGKLDSYLKDGQKLLQQQCSPSSTMPNDKVNAQELNQIRERANGLKSEASTSAAVQVNGAVPSKQESPIKMNGVHTNGTD